MHIAVQRGHFGLEATAHVEMSASGNAPRRRELPVEEDAIGLRRGYGLPQLVVVFLDRSGRQYVLDTSHS
jgi:hypothetical protein